MWEEFQYTNRDHIRNVVCLWKFANYTRMITNRWRWNRVKIIISKKVEGITCRKTFMVIKKKFNHLKYCQEMSTRYVHNQLGLGEFATLISMFILDRHEKFNFNYVKGRIYYLYYLDCEDSLKSIWYLTSLNPGTNQYWCHLRRHHDPLV